LLGRWVAHQRRRYAANRLSPERIRLLGQSPGWTWKTHDWGFDRAVVLLKQFAKREGHTRVPARHLEDGFGLGRYVVHVRRQRQSGRLPEARIRRLARLP
jgi:hypothetical protein